MGFLTDFENQVTTSFVPLVASANADLITMFRGAFVLGLSIWMTLIAYEVAWGKSEDGFTYYVTKVGRVFGIGVLALWGWPAIQELIDAIREGLFVSLGGSSSMATTLENNLLTPMDQLWTKLVIQWETDMLALSGLSKIKDMLIVNFQFLIHAIVYAGLQLVVYAIVVISYAMYFVSYASFQVILALGPFFLFALAFPFTQRFFETWVGAAITASLAMALTAFMTNFSATMLGLQPLNAATTTITFADFSFVSTMLAKAAFAALGIYLYLKIFDLAASLGGGINMGNNMYGAVRSIANDLRRGGRNPSSSGRNTVNMGNTGGGGGQSGAGRTRESNRQYQTMTAAALAATGRGTVAGARIAATGGRLAYQRGVRPVAAAAGQAAARGTVAVGRVAYAGGAALARAARSVANRRIPGITS